MIQYKNIHDENIIMMYKGILTFDLLSSLIGTAEKRINEFESDRKLQKKFYSILTESLQNMHFHIEKVDDSQLDANKESVLILIVAKKKFYYIKTCNYIQNFQINKIRERIDTVNSLGKDELKEMYRAALSNNEFSEKNTAGLGLLEIARKTERPLKYDFEAINDNYSYFNLEIKIDRQAKVELSNGLALSAV